MRPINCARVISTLKTVKATGSSSRSPRDTNQEPVSGTKGKQSDRAENKLIPAKADSTTKSPQTGQYLEHRRIKS